MSSSSTSDSASGADRPDCTVTTFPMYQKRKLSLLSDILTQLFKEGTGSDIKIHALNREWDLHKHILSQSPYFRSMFSGSRTEKKRRKINLDIEDVNITAEALNTVFESLYADEIHIELTDVVPILACARFLLLGDLINHCGEVMKACINKNTAVRIFEASRCYGITEVENLSIEFLLRTVWDILETNPKIFTLISEDLLKELLSSPNLCLPEEKYVFSLLISWMFLKENFFNFDYDSLSELYKSSIIYFEENVSEKPFFETDGGIPYQPLFRAIRLKDIVLDVRYKEIEKLNIFPTDWILPVFRTHWYNTIRMLQGLDEGPQSISEEVFDRECVRISGFIVGDEDSFNYSYFDSGFGLDFRFANTRFKMKRYLKDRNLRGSAGLGSLRYLMYRVYLFDDNIDGGVLSKVESGIRTVSIAPNRNIDLVIFPLPWTFPIRYRINFLLTTP